MRSRWLSVSVEDKSVFYQPETVQYLALLWAQECLRSHYSLLTVTYQFLLFYTLHYWFSITKKHCGGIESFYHLSEITAHALIRFHTLRGLGSEYARPPPHICACTLSSIFMDHSHCHTHYRIRLQANWASLGLSFSLFLLVLCSGGSMKETLSWYFSTFQSSSVFSAVNGLPVEGGREDFCWDTPAALSAVSSITTDTSVQRALTERKIQLTADNLETLYLE